MEFEIGDWVYCTRLISIPKIDGTSEPAFFTHEGQILSIKSNGYEVWGPGGEQSVVVGSECLKLSPKHSSQ